MKKRILAVLFTLVLCLGLLPATALAAENTAPTVEQFATVDQLRTAFDMDDDTTDKTFKKVYFSDEKKWCIAGIDPIGKGLVLVAQNFLGKGNFYADDKVKDYDATCGVTYEDDFMPTQVAPNHYGTSDMRKTFQSYTDPTSGACLFTAEELALITPTTIYTEDTYNKDETGNPRVYFSEELLYPTYATEENVKSYVTVGSNSADQLETDLKIDVNIQDGRTPLFVSQSFTRAARYPSGNIDHYDYAYTNYFYSNSSYFVGYKEINYLPVFQLDTSNVLFGSIYKGVTKEGEQKDTFDYKIFTLRMDAGKYGVNLGTANITAPALEYVTVSDAPEGTFLVVQCGEGAWAKAVSGDMTFSASAISGGDITSFENCQVWLEKTDSEARLTYAAMATTAEAYSVNVTGNAKLVWDGNSGAESQVSLDNAPIQDIVYTAVEDYCFPADYCDNLSGNGITVTRNSDTQITISGTPTQDVNLTLPLPDYCGTKDWWDGTTVASGYESGTGTEDDPYVIASAEQFVYFAQQMEGEENGAGEYFVLTADLELTAADWKPIFRFDGSFDGNGHTIVYTQQTGRYSTNDVNQRFYYFGLFGVQKGTVSNLYVSGDILVGVLSDVNIAELNVGGICGYNRGTVTHCYSDVEIRFAEGISSAPNVGGIAGQVDNDQEDPGVVECCGYTGSITGSLTVNNGPVKAGGIAGHIRGGTIRQCFNKGTIVLTSSNTVYAGGIIGSIYDMTYTKTRVIESCYNWGNISVDKGSGTAYVGGIGGNLEAEEGTGGNYYPPSTIRGCYSTGKLASSSDNTSPLSPMVDGHVEVSHNYCLEGGDDNTTKVADKEALFEALNAFAANTWFTDTVTGEVRLLWELKVNSTPEAVFSADSESSGVLSNVEPGMRYSLDGGATWIEITDTTAAITGVTTENGILVYWPGDFHETSDSEVQVIVITKADAPTTVQGQACTTSAQNDGSIIGVDSTMEYRLEDEDTWTAITGDSVTGLKPGTYLVRVRGNGTALASEAVSVIISPYYPTRYPIYVEETDHGAVEAPTRAEAKESVTFTVTPDKGFMLGSLTVTDRQGNDVAYKSLGDGKYSFTMPWASVTIKAVFVPDTLPFVDVKPTDWFYEAVAYVYEHGLMDGVGSNRFAPNASTTRAMIVTILWRLEGEPEADDTMPFADVAADTWYTEAVRWAAGEGIVEGYSETAFGPNDPITREQLAAILWRYAKYLELDVSVGEDTNILSYTDAAEISEYAIPALQWACGSGLMEGANGSLSPRANATRAEVATMLMRVCEACAN